MSNVDLQIGVEVSVKQSLSDKWEVVPYLWPEEVQDATAPQIPRTRLMYDFGEIKRADQNQVAYYNPLDIANHYVRVRTEYDGEIETHFVGLIAEVTMMIQSEGRGVGQQFFECVGLGHVLDRIPLAHGFVEAPNNQVARLDWMPAFNRRGRRGFSKYGNRSANIGPDGAYLFALHAGPTSEPNTVGVTTEPDEWTNLQIIEYLLAYFAPPEWGGISLTGLTGALDSIREIHEPARWRTLWDAINALIDRRKGLFFKLVAIGDQATTLAIRVNSVARQDIAIGSWTLPANDDQQAFTLPSDFPFYHLVDVIPFLETSFSEYDEAIIRGERVKATASFAPADETLGPWWTEALEEEYDGAYNPYLAIPANADLDPNNANRRDALRLLERYEGVYTRFIVPRDWDWQVGDGEGGAKTNLSITPLDDGTFDFGAPAGAYIPGKTFLRETCFETAVDYTFDPVHDRRGKNIEAEFQPIALWVKDSVDDEMPFNHEKTERWYRVDRLSDAFRGISEPAVKSASVRPLDADLGCQISIQPQHYFAITDFDREEEVTSEDGFPAFEWRKFILTATVELDVRQQIKIDLNSAAPADHKRTLIVDVPEAEYWFVAAGTVIDTANDGGLRRCVHRVLRNDLSRLQAMAAFVTAWYGQRRQCVRINIRRARNWVPLGALLTEINSVHGLQQDVNTVVTSRTLTFPRGDVPSCMIETGWSGLDESAVLATQAGSKKTMGQTPEPG